MASMQFVYALIIFLKFIHCSLLWYEMINDFVWRWPIPDRYVIEELKIRNTTRLYLISYNLWKHSCAMTLNADGDRSNFFRDHMASPYEFKPSDCNYAARLCLTTKDLAFLATKRCTQKLGWDCSKLRRRVITF